MVTPANWEGSLPELLVFNELRRRGLEPNLDFTYQSSLFGGRQQRGGYDVDFLFSNPPNLAIEVQGLYFHYELGGADQIADDKLKRATLAGEGITVIFVDEDDVLSDVRGIIGDALNFIDRSRLG